MKHELSVSMEEESKKNFAKLQNSLSYKKELRLLYFGRYVPFKTKARKKLEKRHELKLLLEDDWKILYRDLADYTLSKLEHTALVELKNSLDGKKETEIKKRFRSIREALELNSFAFEMYETKIKENSLHAFDTDNGGLYEVIIKIPQIENENNQFIYFVKRYNTQKTYEIAVANQLNVARFSRHVTKRIERTLGLEETVLSSLAVNNTYRLVAEEFIGEGITLQKKIRDLQQKEKETKEDAEKERIRSEMIALYKDAISTDIGLNQELIVKEVERVIRLAALSDEKVYDRIYEKFKQEKDESRLYRRSLERLNPQWQEKCTADEIIGLEQLIGRICKPLGKMAKLLLHGDLHAKNILYDFDGKTILIDPEKYAVSNIFYDIVRLTMHSGLSAKETDELVVHGTKEYNRLIRENPIIFVDYTEITTGEGKDIFQRITALESLQMVSMMYRKSKVAKKKHDRKEAAAYARECYQKAYRIIENFAFLQDSLQQLSAVYGKLVGAEIVTVDEKLPIPQYQSDSSDSETSIRAAEGQGLASILGKTAVADLNQSRGLLAKINEKKSRLGKKLRMPAAITVFFAIVGSGIYIGYRGVEHYQHEKEIAAFKEKIMDERKGQILERRLPEFYGILSEEKTKEYRQALDAMTKIRQDLIYGPDTESFRKTLAERDFEIYHIHPSIYNLQQSWMYYYTVVEHNAKSFKIDANLLRAVIAASDWINQNGEASSQYVSLTGGDQIFCFQPIIVKEMRNLGIGDYQAECQKDQQSINRNILAASQLLKEKMEKYGDDIEKALLEFYAGEYYFVDKEFLESINKKYNPNCFEPDYWSIRLYDAEQYQLLIEGEKIAQLCYLQMPESVTHPANFVEIAMVFYQRFQQEFGDGRLWKDNAIAKALQPKTRDFYHR